MVNALSVIRSFAVLVLVALAILPTGSPPLAVELRQGERAPVPELRFQDMEGNELTLAALQGRVVVLNLWATWCAPCREEMPGLDRLQGMFPKEDVVVLALSLDRGDGEKVAKFIAEIGAERLTVYRDPKAEAARVLKVPGLPATILVDRQGREAARVLGIDEWDGELAQAAVRALAEEPAS